MNAITPLRILPAFPEASAPRGGVRPGGFSETLREAVAEVDRTQTQAESVVRGVLEGTGMDVHKAVIAVEKADLSFQLMLQVRNKIVAAYQEVERLQF